MTDVLNGGGELGTRMRSLDWASTPFGISNLWPQSLQSAISICLNSRFPIAIYWGPQLALLYNDAWSPILGEKHPWALGRPGREVWPEIWTEIGPLFDAVQHTGEGVWQQDQLLPMHRHGYTEECYFNFTFSPIRGEDGSVVGIFNAVIETTFRVIEERRAQLLRDLSDCTAGAKSASEVCTNAARVLGSSSADVPFCLFYMREHDSALFQLAASAGTTLPESLRPLTLDPDDPSRPWPIVAALHTPQGSVADQIGGHFGVILPSGIWPEAVEQAIIMPIPNMQALEPVGLFIAGISPRRALDEAYHTFIERITLHIATAIGNVRSYEAERQRAETLAMIDQARTVFFSNISHEFRTPLTLLLGPLEDTLAQTEGLPADAREHLEVAHRNALRLLKLVNTLLDFSRIESGRAQAAYEPTDLAVFTTVLASVFRSTIERAGLRLIVNCPPLAEPMYIDHDMWDKIVFNLLSNAFKFTFIGEIEVALRRVDSAVELIVRDTGTGIPGQEIPHLFERFHRVKGAHGRTFEGSGIGLALVQELVKLHNGTVRVESAEQHGTTFTVTIPIGIAHLPAELITMAHSPPRIDLSGQVYIEEALRWLPNEANAPVKATQVQEIASPEHMNVQPASAPSHTRILLVDDNADMREYIRRLLSEKYVVVAVNDGADALRVVQEQSFDLVLADVMMPHLDGFGLLAALRADERTKALPLILLSARAGEEARAEGMEAGADDYLIKPFSARELLARIGAHVSMARMRREAAQRERELITEAQAAKAQLENVLASVSDQFLALDHNWQYVFVNDRVTEVTGLPREELLGRNMWELFPETVGTTLEQELRRAMLDQVPVHAEFLFSRQKRWFENRAYPSSTGLTLYIADITERKHRELNATFLSDITANLALLTNSAEMLQTVSENIANHLNISRCLFCEIDQQSSQVTIFHEYHGQGLLALDPSQRAADWISPVFWNTLVAGHNVMIHDVATDLRTAPGLQNMQQAQIGSCIVAPCLSGGRLKFVLVVSHTQPHHWRLDEDDLIHEIALRIWLSTDRARAEAELRANTVRQSLLLRLLQGQRETSNPDVMLAAAAEAAGRYLGANRVGFFDMHDDDTLLFSISWTDGVLEPLTGTFPAIGIGTRYLAEMRAGRTLGIADTTNNSLTADSQLELIGARSIIGVPIIRNGCWHAGFYVNHAMVRQWTDAEIALIHDVGEQTWDAVERARAEAALHKAQSQRLAEEQQYAERLLQLNAAAVEINAALSVEEVLSKTVQKARTLIGTDLAVVTLTPGGDWMQAQTVTSRAEQAADWQEGDARSVSEEIFRLLFGQRRTLRLNQQELAAHPAFHNIASDPMLHPRLNGLLAAPLTDGDDVLIGLIQLSDKIAGQFTVADEALLQQFAQMASVALENQALYEQEQALRTQEEAASRLKDEFLATVSHELRTPLTALLGYSQLLQARKRDEAYVARTAEKLVRSAKDQALIIDDLLDVSRIVSGKLQIEAQPMDLIDVIYAALDTVRPAIEAKELHLQVDLHPEARMIIGDANRLQQVVWNLLSNATKFTPSGGSIHVLLEQNGRNAQLTVRDTGQGIRPVFLPFVFDRFRQADSASNRSHGGLGLGLSIVRHLVELHGGTVQAASPGEDQGATFTVRLPLATTGDMKSKAIQLEHDDDQVATCPPELRGLRVLVVDDQPNILDLLHETLTSCGAIVQACNNAREALAMLHDWQPEVLVSDIAMPNEDGYWLIGQVRALAADEGGAIPAIALTAYVRVEEQVRVLAAGFQLYVPKPIKPTELRNVIAHLVRMETHT